MENATQTTMTFFNTINLKDEELKEARIVTNRQEERILDIMPLRRAMTPFEVLEDYCRLYPAVPITSIRRAMTCLTFKGKLAKLATMKSGMYGKPNHKWEKLSV